MLLGSSSSASTLLWVLAAGLILYRFYRFLFDKPPNFPSGPPRLPFLGGYGFMLMLNYWQMHKASEWLEKFYRTKIIGIYLGSFLSIIVNDFHVVKEIMNRTEFDGRPDLFLARLRERNFQRRGIFFTEGPDWKEQRRFVLRNLRDFGFGRRFEDLEMETRSEIETLLDVLRYGPKYEHEKAFARKEGSALCPDVFYGCLANVYFQVVCGERFLRKDMADVFETGRWANVFQTKGDDFGTVLSYLPWLRKLFPEATNYRPLRESNDRMNDLLEKVLTRYLASYEEGHVRCFLDRYFCELKKTTPLDGQNFSFQYDQLLLIMLDFFLPTISGTAEQISMLLQRLILNPSVTKKIQTEIDEVVGHGRLPNLDDRSNLPYTEAALREGLRIDTLVPSGISHVTLEDTKLRGYDIPKGTVVMLSLDLIHHQKGVWDDPEEFRPERFLDERGKLCLAKDISVVFGAGKRLCAGETFARNTMFLMFAALMQNFNILQMPGEPLPDLNARKYGIITTTVPFWLQFEQR
ncbi:probable cytochrome P450 304a1 [Uranotaenia lowii]|uniref:probable cytochrome P450 304a1 n=1 Tax=Uranotaenia lowii TaxID=190385 RepID=UPI0024791983|nr:probable cytochrome P450 304a1 [Uranotaenia lowii]